MTDYAVDRHRAYLERSLGAHAAYTLHYHLVWSVKARRPLLIGPVAEMLRECLLASGEEAGISILALHIEPEHAHILISLRPDLAVAEAVRRLKGSSARRLRMAFPQLATPEQQGLWNTGYFARTLGDVSVAQAKAYLDRQGAHHDHDAVGTGAD